MRYIKDGTARQGPNGGPNPTERAMHALKDLFTSDVGLMSLAGIVFMLGMGVFFVRFFLSHMREDAARHDAPRPLR